MVVCIMQELFSVGCKLLIFVEKKKKNFIYYYFLEEKKREKILYRSNVPSFLGYMILRSVFR